MIYTYQCENGHRHERIRKMADRDVPLPCATFDCGKESVRVLDTPHAMPDGMYSYAPNVGSEAAFARRLDMQRAGVRCYKKEA